METKENYELIKRTGQTTTEKGLQWFDELEPVNLDFMLGRWQGCGLRTNHPMDGFLEVSSWYGKEFVNSETSTECHCYELGLENALVKK